MTATLNDRTCATVRASIPRYGVGRADVLMADMAILSEAPGAASLIVAGLTLRATVVQQGVFGGQRSAQLVFGYGGWRKVAPPQGYRQGNPVKLEDFAVTLGSVVGEVVETSSAARGRQLGRLVTRLGAIDAGSLLSHACALPPGSAPVPWWIAPNGTTQLGERLGAAIPVALQHVDADPLDRWRAYASDVAGPLLPGAVVDGRTAEELQVRVDGTSSTLVVTLGTAATVADTPASWMRRVVIGILGPHVSASRIYRYTLTKIMEDGRYNARPVRSALAPDLAGLAFWPGIAGARCKPQEDSQILVQFADGNPADPIVVGFEPARAAGLGIPQVTELDGARVNLGDGAAGQRVACLTDGVGSGELSIGSTGGTVHVIYATPDGPPKEWIITGAVVAGAVVLLVTTDPILFPSGTAEIRGKIDDVGQPKVYA